VFGTKKSVVSFQKKGNIVVQNIGNKTSTSVEGQEYLLTFLLQMFAHVPILFSSLQTTQKYSFLYLKLYSFFTITLSTFYVFLFLYVLFLCSNPKSFKPYLDMI